MERNDSETRPPGFWLVIGLLLALTAGTRAHMLGPLSLWLDDAWVAVIHKASAQDAWRLGVTAPAFTQLIRVSLRWFGDGSLVAQAVPFICGLMLPVGCFLVCRRYFGLWPGASAATLLALAPMHVEQSARVKQFTLDALCTLAITFLVLRIQEKPGRLSRWNMYAFAGLVFLVVSSPIAIVLIAGLVVALWSFARNNTAPPIRKLAFPVTILIGGIIAFWLGVLVRAVNPSLRSYWEDHFISRESVLDWLQSSWQALDGFAAGLLPLVHVAGLVLGLSLIYIAYRSDFAAKLLLMSLGGAYLAALLGIAPLGTGRTDIYLYPLAAVALASALQNARLPIQIGATLGLLGMGLIGHHRYPPEYPMENLRPIVEIIDRESSGALVLIDPGTSFAYGLYTEWPIAFRLNENITTGFLIEIEAERFHTISPLRRPQKSPVRKIVAQIKGLSQSSTAVWFVYRYPSPLRQRTRGALSRLGFKLTDVLKTQGARAESWTRPAVSG